MEEKKPVCKVCGHSAKPGYIPISCPKGFRGCALTHYKRCLTCNAVEIKKHCLYVGLENKNRFCCYPGIDAIDGDCSGYENCTNYKEGSRYIEEEK